MITLRKHLEGKKLVIFDLDGTIINTHSLVLDALNATLLNLHAYPIDSMPEGIYMQDLITSTLAVQGIKTKIKPKELSSQVFTKYLEILDTTNLEVKAGFWEAVFLFKEQFKLPIALCSNTERAAVSKLLNKLNIKNTFDLVLCGDDVPRPKPSPDIYKKVLNHFKIPAHKALAFEDSPSGAASSVGAGIETFVIWDSITNKNEFPQEVEYFYPDFTLFKSRLDFDIDRDLKYFKERFGSRVGL